MPYDEVIEERIQNIIFNWDDVASKKMFGGVCYLFRGNMFCGIYKEYLIVRLNEENALELLSLPYTKPFDITGKPMKGWVMVEEGGFESDEALRSLLEKARNHAASLPEK